MASGFSRKESFLPLQYNFPMFSPSLVPPRLFLATLVCALFLAPVAAQQSRAQRTGQAETKEDLVNARPGRDRTSR